MKNRLTDKMSENQAGAILIEVFQINVLYVLNKFKFSEKL